MSEKASPSDGPHPQSGFGHPVTTTPMRSASDHRPSAVGQAGGAARAQSQPEQSARAPRNAGGLPTASVADTIAQRLSQQEAKR
jgi:hypothetical protein